MDYLVYLTDATTVVEPSAWKPVIDALTNQISVTTVMGVLAGGVAAAVGLYFAWFGLRKVIGMIKGALRGRLRV